MKKLFDTVCPHCGKNFKIPFDPAATPRKILCSSCFSDKRDHPSERTIALVKLPKKQKPQ